MIHSLARHRPFFCGPLDQTIPPQPPLIEGPAPLPSDGTPVRWPGEYYASPTAPLRPLFPRWVPFGCGSAALVAILILFVGGAIAGSGGAGMVFEMVFGAMQDEIDGMFTKQVQPPQKAAFDAEMKALRERMKGPGVGVDRLQPLLRMIREASSDGQVTPQEADALTAAVRAVTHAPPAAKP